MGWAVFFSLAATWKIEFSFFSSCYLDVSVRRVLLHKAMYSLYDDCVFHSRVSPFGYLGVSAFCELALVFVHLRPSSSSCAKASTLRPFFLDWKYCLLFNFYSLLSGSCFLMYRLIIHTISVVVFMPIVLCTLGKT